MTSPSATSEEQEQILQTIQMFEVITQANPQDCQSMEILKEAYWKSGRNSEALAIARKLADTYMELGQYSSALLEYEGILQKQPDSPDIVAMLGEVEAKLYNSEQEETQLQQEAVNFDGFDEEATLIATTATLQHDETPRTDLDLQLGDDGNAPLAKFLIQHRLAPADVVNTALERVTKTNANLPSQTLASSLIEEVCNSRVVELEPLLCGILDRSKFAYVPLEFYDVDRQIVRMLPESLTLKRLIVPFDLISRTIMIAVANPFDAPGKEAVQQLFDYNIQWHLASPASIANVLRESYKLSK